MTLQHSAIARFAAFLQSSAVSPSHLTLQLNGQFIDDLDAGLPREQSEAAAIVEHRIAQHPRLNYICKNMPQIDRKDGYGNYKKSKQ